MHSQAAQAKQQALIDDQADDASDDEDEEESDSEDEVEPAEAARQKGIASLKKTLAGDPFQGETSDMDDDDDDDDEEV